MTDPSISLCWRWNSKIKPFNRTLLGPLGKEYIVNLRQYHSTKQKVSSNPMIKLKDLVLVHDDCAPRHLWRTGVVTELYNSNLNNQIRRASVRLNRSGQTIKRPINKLYSLEMKMKVRETNWRTWADSHRKRLPSWEK